MVDRDPPAAGLSAGFGKAHGVHEIIGDIAPLLVREGARFGAQAQRAVPHAGVLVADVDALFLGRVPLHVFDLNRYVIGPARLVKMLGDCQGIVTVQDTVVVPRHDRCVACYRMRIGVCVLGLVGIGKP
ncbi:hypothetical protein [Arthrobacter sp. ES3-54]|uniref:hypothetical protein n=1 Tax=Arthrobacter sp. ES3-54 TaxID=1502991 RepID=UPI002406D21C|nr:hypothetical protein [Arthrobacter sp. ES3-54]MDF9750283.1 hypothetical protein [Arthrobacter sp. ES3-54]